MTWKIIINFSGDIVFILTVLWLLLFFKTGKTCLFYAAHCGDFNICKELLDKGADVNSCDNHKV